MNNFMLHVPGLGIEAMNAIKSVAEIGSISFELYTIRTEKTGAELSAMIEPVLGPNPQYLLAGVDNLAIRLATAKPTKMIFKAAGTPNYLDINRPPDARTRKHQSLTAWKWRHV